MKINIIHIVLLAIIVYAIVMFIKTKLLHNNNIFPADINKTSLIA